MAMASKTADGSEDSSLLSKLDELVPAPLAQFDAFPKLPETYKTHSESRGFLTLFVAFLAFLLILNDLGEFIWGWPDYEFGVDKMPSATLDINVDMVVNMPCQCEYVCRFMSLKHGVCCAVPTRYRRARDRVRALRVHCLVIPDVLKTPSHRASTSFQSKCR